MATFSSVSISLSRPVLTWSLFLLVSIVIYYLSVLVYRLFFSPLSKIPGPWITRISAVPEANALKNQRRTDWVRDLFNQYAGAVAIRTGPNSVSFNHPDAVKAIYGHGKGAEEFGKSSWYDAFSTTGESLFSTRSKKRHAIKRRMVAHGFSMQSLYLFEPIVDQTLDKFLRKMDDFAATGEPFDIYFWFELFTMDLMGELAFGRPFGTLDAGKPARYSTLVELSQRYGNLSGILPFGKYSVKVLSWVPLPYIQKLWKARVEYLEYARMALEKRFQDDRRQTQSQVLPTTGNKPRQDIMQRFIEAQDPETGHRMDFAELRAEASSLMVAGASTGSVTLTWLTYYLCKKPTIKSRIIESLESMFPPESSTTSNLPFSKLNKLALLEAAEIECLRMHPPIGYAMPRLTPPKTGAVICGIYVPPNVDVGVPAAIIGRNPTVYRDPDVWDPERWLASASATSTASGLDHRDADLSTMKTAFLGFGHGSRQCIGRNVATQFITKMMAALLLKYDIALEDPALQLGTKEFTILKPDRKFNVVLRPRNGREAEKR
ncbi:Cytochrome P450 monooxygenase [Exophiala dermatitidis]